MFGWVLGNKHGQGIGVFVFSRLPAKGDTAGALLGREQLMVRVDIHDVVVFGHRPVGPHHTFGGVVHRVFGAQALKMGPQGVVGKQRRVRRVQFFKGH